MKGGENVKKIKSFFAFVLIWILGYVSVFPKWNFWTAIEKIAHNPEYSMILVRTVAATLIFAIIMALLMLLKENDESEEEEEETEEI
jgi:uncharacterized membrane protein